MAPRSLDSAEHDTDGLSTADRNPTVDQHLRHAAQPDPRRLPPDRPQSVACVTLMNHLTRLEDRIFRDHTTLYRSSRSVFPGRVRSIGIAMEPRHRPCPDRATPCPFRRPPNWAAIGAAATTTCAETAHTIDVRKIAERAGVGIGTLYRILSVSSE